MADRRGGVLGAALVSCTLFVLEDPAAAAVRHRLAPHRASVAVDLALAAVMFAYNYAASRYVVGISSAAEVTAALDQLETERRRRADRPGRRLLGRINPFALVRAAADRVGAVAERASAAAHRRRRTGLARVLGDIAAVNVLGVPGVGLERAARGRSVDRRDSLRHTAIFVLSWFAGARAIEAVVVHVTAWPVIGDVARPMVTTVGTVFRALTSIDRPFGAITVVVVVVVVARLARRVDRLARQTRAVPPAPWPAPAPSSCVG